MKRTMATNQGRALSILVLVSLLLTLAGSSSAATPPTAGGKLDLSDNISSRADGVTVDSDRPWTVDRMNAAKPYPMEAGSADGAKDVPAEPADGPAQMIPGALPGGERVKSLAEQTFSNLASTGGFTYPGPYTRYEVFTAYTGWPYLTIGKMFFTQLGKDYVCSGAVIGEYSVWTAGHCVHAGNNSYSGWSTNVVFCPAYKDGVTPSPGCWTSYDLWTKTVWYTSGNPGGLRQDMGGIVLNRISGYGIGHYIGWLGFGWNWAYEQHWNIFGYPAASPFSGQRLITCEATYAYKLEKGTGGPAEQAVGCDQTGGSSGGPWILLFGSGNYLNGENSFRRTAYPQEMAGPHFNNKAKDLWNYLTGDIP